MNIDNNAQFSTLQPQEECVTFQDGCATFNDFSELPIEIAYEIFSFLDKCSDLESLCLVNKKWNLIASDERLWKSFRPKLFGAKEWLECLEINVGEEPPLPKGIYKTLKSQCPFTENKTIEETYFVILVPGSINGKKFESETLGDHLHKKNMLCPSVFGVNLGSNKKSRWIIVKDDILPESRGKRIDEHVNLLKKCGQQNYKAPTLAEAIVWIVAKYFNSEKRLFWDNSMTFTRCDNGDFRKTYVGAIGFNELGIKYTVVDYKGDKNLGIVGVLKKHNLRLCS